MTWSIRLQERASESWGSPLVWWVKQSEANRKIKELKIRIKELEKQLEEK